MSTTPETPSAPETRAASLLFQAPTFQPPTFVEPGPVKGSPSDEEKPSAPRKRRSSRRAPRAVSSESEPEEAAPERENAPAEPPTEDEEARPRAHTRRSRHSQKNESVEEAPPGSDGGDAQKSEPEAAGPDVDAVEDEAEGESTTKRRRRRRSRSSSSTEFGGEASDQVRALKGSTRLEAKKMRRREGRREDRRHHVITESEFLARRESVTRQMVIRHRNGLDQIAVIEDDLLVEHYVARRTQQSAVGNIYLGRVQNVLPSMEAAFIDIGRGRNAVLYAGEVNWDAVGLEGHPRRIENALRSGDAILVQVTKDPIGHKGARLTSQITLAGRFLVLIPHGSMMGISRKLPEPERQRLKKILKKVVPAGSGVIVRTAAEGASDKQLSDDVERLVRQWTEIERKQTNTKSAPTLLRGEPELALRVVRDIFNEDFTRLVIEGAETHETVKAYIDDRSPELSDRVEQWVDTEDVFHSFRVDEQLAKGMDRKVWLPSGGTLIIDRTEAMTVIDVNTGKYIGAGGTLEETVTRNNLEAAEEIVRQLRLRDIGGIVIVDFVDMVLESNRDLVLRRLVECLGRDRTRHQVTEITSLGLVQMTRKRVGEGLVEAFSTPCEVCEGRGFIVHHDPVEHTGSEDHTGGHQRSKRQKKSSEEARKSVEGPGAEQTRTALSAIAAASGHTPAKETEKLSDAEGVPATIESETPSASVEPEDTVSEPVKPKRKPRRRRATSGGTIDPGAPASGPSSLETSVDLTVAAEESTPEVPAAPEPEESAAPTAKRSRRRAASRSRTTKAAVVEAPETPAPETGSTGPAETAGPAKKPRRRRAVATAVVGPLSESAPVAPEADPEPTSVMTRDKSGRTHKATTLDDIALPDTHVTQAAPRKRRRRVASTGVVEATPSQE